ncbi:MAG: hypothetical protein NDI66_03490, partial [Pseudomonas sp.]|nr:hypothetical protein [Pseudomonas sp.]
GKRMRGEGPFAQLIAQRFARAHARLGFARLPPLDASAFVAPAPPPKPPRPAKEPPPTPQGQLF